MAEMIEAANKLGAWQFLCVILVLAVIALWRYVVTLHAERREEYKQSIESAISMTHAMQALREALLTRRDG